MKIAVSQSNYHIGNFESNFQKIKSAIQRAKTNGVDLIIFSELAVCGYPPRDFLEFNDFINRCEEVVNAIAKESKGIAVMVGSPTRNPVVEGKDLYNSAIFIEDGEVKQEAHKALLPTYDIFDEYRYFEPNHEFKVVEFKGKRIALTVCEDLWNIGNKNPLYKVCPMDILIEQSPDFIVNLSASPFDYDHAETRIAVLKANCERYKLPIFYVNHAGAQTEVIFDGGSLVMQANGTVYDELPYFIEDYREYELAAIMGSTVAADKVNSKEKTALIHDAIVLGIKDYFGKLGFKQAILGLSGGIDSAVTLVLAARALGPDNVRAVLLPSEYSSGHSVNDSVELTENLGTPYDNISIQHSYESFLDSLQEPFAGTEFSLAEENIQARTRGVILMALSNKFGYILLNTSNKSEAAVGYGTLYGDMCGGLSVLGDVYKTEVYDLAYFINKDGEVIPEHIITKPPSAELRPNQKDSDSLPPYDLLDKLLFQYIELRKGPKELVKMGFEKPFVDRVLKLVNTNEYKRYQTPPMLRVSPKAFGMGRRMPIVGKYLS